MLLTDVLSLEECSQLLELAEATSNGKWEQALVNVGGGRQKLYTDIRSCDRIIWDSYELAQRLLDRIRVFLQDITELKDSAKVTGHGPVKRGETFRMTRLNERMRFLKYDKGCYFREHCDGSCEIASSPCLNQDANPSLDVTPDGSEISYITLHLYLNEADPQNPLKGGATRFHSLHYAGRYYDVEPKTGSVLVFQHRGLRHSGDELEAGTKYTMRTDIMYEKAKAD